MSKLQFRGAIAAVFITLPFAALADTTLTLSMGSTLNLDTGKTVSSGGDINWDGTNINFVGSAKGYDLMGAGQEYSSLTQAALSLFAAELGSSPVTPAANDLIVVKTNDGNYSKILINSVGASLGIEFTTYTGSSSGGGGGGAPPPSGPSITAVVNNYSYIPTGFTNSGIAPGTIMLIFGSGMSQTPSSVFLNSTVAPGLPQTWEQAKLSVTVGSTTVIPAIYYATPTQIAAELPSNTPTGTASITVSYNGQTSAAFQFQVVPHALGFNTYYGNGTGLFLAVDATSGAIITYTNSAKPGETILMFGSGLGADTADSDTTYTAMPHAVSTPLAIYFGNVAGKVLYSGSSGYPGYDQINVTIPANAPTDCFVGVVGVAGMGSTAVTSNFGLLPISASGGDCTSALLGVTGQEITSLGGMSTVRSGSVFVSQLVGPANPPATGTMTTNSAGADFSKTTGTAYSTTNETPYSIGSCYVTEITSSSGGGTSTTTGLDAGSSISLTGPEGTYSLPKSQYVTGDYYEQLPANAIPTSGGAFTFTGSGGADVGSFTATVTLPNPILQWTNQSAANTVTRAQGVTVNWTGGGPGTYVIIMGQSDDINSGVSGSFTCYAPQSALTFTVPTYVLLTLPAGTGSLALENGVNFGTFTASGLDFGTTFGSTGVSISNSYQ
jgi:uncharacterized protein (TIGR03437 family)